MTVEVQQHQFLYAQTQVSFSRFFYDGRETWSMHPIDSTDSNVISSSSLGLQVSSKKVLQGVFRRLGP